MKVFFVVIKINLFLIEIKLENLILDVIKISALAGGAGKKERVEHPTQKPLELCQKLIKASKNKEDTLLIVPFAGSGSECVAAKKENVNFIGFEINEQYIKLSNQRLETL
jgi:site-specific DNA-methyltransferase (adenine-specific)